MKAFILYYYSVNTLFRNSSDEDGSRLSRPSPALPLQTQGTNEAFGKTPVSAGTPKTPRSAFPGNQK